MNRLRQSPFVSNHKPVYSLPGSLVSVAWVASFLFFLSSFFFLPPSRSFAKRKQSLAMHLLQTNSLFFFTAAKTCYFYSAICINIISYTVKECIINILFPYFTVSQTMVRYCNANKYFAEIHDT